MKFSIIIPACNAQNTIERAVRSVFDNTSSDIECIVILNNSTDKTLEVCQRLSQEYSDLIIRDINCSGVSAARNEGINIATGDVIGFADADDKYEKNAIDSVIDIFTKTDADIVTTRFLFLKTDGTSTAGRLLGNKFIGIEKYRQLLILDNDVMGTVWNKFYKKDVIGRTRFNPVLSHCEDTHFNMCILKNDQLKVYLSDEITYTYFETPGSASRDVNLLFDSQFNLKYFAAFDKIEEIYIDNKSLAKTIGYKRLKLAVENYQDKLSIEQKDKLVDVMKTNLKYSCKLGSDYRNTWARARRILEENNA